MPELKYKRISLKLSGEALGGSEPVDLDSVMRVANEIKELHLMGAEIGVTCGGGNIWRGARNGSELNRNRADHMGMLATAIKSLALSETLTSIGVPNTVLASVPMPRFCETYTYYRAEEELSAGRVVIFACGTGSPLCTTDTAAALKAAEINADALLLAKNVDAVYSADPNKDSSATRYETLTYDEVIDKKLGATDLTAMTLCRENGIPIIVFALNRAGALNLAAQGKNVGTVIS